MPFRQLALGVSFLSVLFLLTTSTSAQTDIPGVGSWKLNVSKSKMGSEPPPRSIISTIEVVGDRARVTGVRIGADGIRTEIKYTARIDGKDYPISGSPNADTISLRRIDARTVERIDKKSGKIVESSTTVFSEDGKTSTTRGKATNVLGDEFQYTVVNEKQL